MTVLVQASFGGSIRQTGPRRLEADYPFLFITVMMAFPTLIFTAGGVFSIIGAAAMGQPMLLVPAVMGLVAGGSMGALALYRFRSMGDFRLDVDEGRFVHLRRGRVLSSYPLTDITRLSRRWDPLHRSFVQHHWLVVETRDGRSFRLGKGPLGQVEYTLGLLRHWGLPA